LVEGLDTLNTTGCQRRDVPRRGLPCASRALRAHRSGDANAPPPAGEGLRRGEAAERVNPDRRV